MWASWRWCLSSGTPLRGAPTVLLTLCAVPCSDSPGRPDVSLPHCPRLSSSSSPLPDVLGDLDSLAVTILSDWRGDLDLPSLPQLGPSSPSSRVDALARRCPSLPGTPCLQLGPPSALLLAPPSSTSPGLARCSPAASASLFRGLPDPIFLGAVAARSVEAHVSPLPGIRARLHSPP